MISFWWWFHRGDNNIPPTQPLKPGFKKQEEKHHLMPLKGRPPHLPWWRCINIDWKSEFFLDSGSLCGWVNQPGPEAATQGGALLHWAYIHKNTLQVAKSARRGDLWGLDLVTQCLMQDLAQNREGLNKYFWSEWVYTFTAKKKKLFNFLIEVAMDSRRKGRGWCLYLMGDVSLMVLSVFLRLRQAN